MSFDKDYSFAQSKGRIPPLNQTDDFLNCTQNLVHPQWETLDPTPDIKVLFDKFDGRFFQGKLACVTLEWSKRMYSCAGICYSRSNGYGKAITIRLSEPLLKLRPRKNLVETLLHEMIHAFCFVMNIREGNGGHGPTFKKIMISINKVAGTNITVYHTFHDEVNLYKQHWWRCNGPCQDRRPFFGYVKRTSNRAPGPNDQWFSKHQKDCGGTFIKVKSPEKKKKATKVKEKDNDPKPTIASGDLRKFLIPQTPKTNSSGNFANAKGINVHVNINGGVKGFFKPNGGGTMVMKPKTKPSAPTKISTEPTTTSAIGKAFPPSSYPGLSSDPFNVGSNPSTSGYRGNRQRGAVTAPGGNLRNVIGFKDIGGLDDSEGDANSGRPISGVKTGITMSVEWGRGNTLTSHSYSSSNAVEGEVDRKHLRDIWSKRFGGATNSKPFSWDKRPNSNKSAGDAKRRRISSEGPSSNETDIIFVSDENASKSENKWVAVDEEVMLKDYQEPVITLSSDDEDQNSNADDYCKPKINPNMTASERQTMIKQEIVDESINLCDDDIELIDDEYDDNIAATTSQDPTNVIEDDFCADLMSDFKRENDCKPSSSKYQNNPDDDIITCFICLEKMPRRVFAEHVNGCTGITRRILPPKRALKKLAAVSKEARPKRPSRPSAHNTRDILRKAGYTEADLAQITSAEETEEEEFLNSSGLGRGLHNGNSTTAISSPQELNSSSEDENTRRHRQRNLFKTTRECPVCQQDIEEAEMNDHLDDCLTK